MPGQHVELGQHQRQLAVAGMTEIEADAQAILHHRLADLLVVARQNGLPCSTRLSKENFTSSAVTATPSLKRARGSIWKRTQLLSGAFSM